MKDKIHPRNRERIGKVSKAKDDSRRRATPETALGQVPSVATAPENRKDETSKEKLLLNGAKEGVAKQENSIDATAGGRADIGQREERRAGSEERA